MQVQTRVEAANSDLGEDRVTVVRQQDRTIIIVADGAGGVAGGAAAADHVCLATRELCEDGSGSFEWNEWLARCDHALALKQPPGQAAAVIVEARNDGQVRGASVGDCEAWIFDGLRKARRQC